MDNTTNQKETEQKVLAFIQPSKVKCHVCGKSDHREIAKYCNECGNDLQRGKCECNQCKNRRANHRGNSGRKIETTNC